MAEQEQKQPEVNTESGPSESAEAPAEQATSPEGAAAPEEHVNDGEAGAEAAESEPSLEDMVTQLQEDVAAARDAALRAQADAQNVKRRAEQDVEKARKFALEGFSKALLPVVDNMERALEAASGDDEAIKPIAEGVELTLKSLMDALNKHHVELVDPQGEPFDPNLHQAMSMVENPDVEPNTVVAVMQKGYVLNGRLIRPAMVMVSKNAG